MHFDISHLLDQWEYQPGKVTVRRFRGKDGRERIQLRVDLGVLQMYAEGRPDGKRPFGHESLLEHHAARLKRHLEEHPDGAADFVLSAEECSKLQQEAIQYHHRYICLFQIEDFPAVLRDTERNTAAFDFVTRYAETEDMAWSVEQFRPQLTMMHTRARALIALREDRHPEAVAHIEAGLEALRNFYRSNNRNDLLDSSGEIHSLETWLDEVRTHQPLSERDKLLLELNDAVTREDYEKAARVRDTLRGLDAASPSSEVR